MIVCPMCGTEVIPRDDDTVPAHLAMRASHHTRPSWCPGEGEWYEDTDEEPEPMPSITGLPIG